MSTPGHPTTPEPACQSPLTLPGIPGPPKWPCLRASDFAQLVGVCADAAGYVVGHRHNGTQPDVGAYRRQLDAQLDRCGIRSPEARARLHDELDWWVTRAERMPLDAPNTRPRTPGPGPARPDRGRGPTRWGWEQAAARAQTKHQQSLPTPEPGPPAPRPRAAKPTRESPGPTPEARPAPGPPAPWLPLRAWPPAALAVHDAITQYANQSGRAWPGRDTLIRLTGYSPRSVERAIAWLRHRGLVKTRRRRGYRGRPSGTLLYQVDRDAARPPRPVPPPKGGA